jgi:hypothetical protein
MGEQSPIGPIIKELIVSEPVFYSGIAKNTLYFHGTSSQERLRAIVKQGLKPPDKAFSKDTLARRISFCDSERYVGGDGAIIAFQPHQDEISMNYPQFAREQPIEDYLDHLPPERAIFYIPRNSRLPREIFYSMKEAVDDYSMHGFNKEPLLNSLKDMVVMVQERLTDEAVSVSKSTMDIHKIAQELVWNELCGRLTFDYDDVKLDTKVIQELREKNKISSMEQLTKLLNNYSSLVTFDTQKYINRFKLLSTIHTVHGLGFEDIPYDMGDTVKATTDWLQTLPETPSMSPKDRLLRLLKPKK